LRILSRDESSGFGQKGGEETKKSENSSSKELVYKVESYKVCKVGKVLDFLLTL